MRSVWTMKCEILDPQPSGFDLPCERPAVIIATDKDGQWKGKRHFVYARHQPFIESFPEEFSFEAISWKSDGQLAGGGREHV